MFRRLKWKLVRFNMALLSLVFAAIFAVTAVLMIVANNRQTQMMLDKALYLQGTRQPPIMGAVDVMLNDVPEVRSFQAPPDVSEEFIQQATSLALAQGQERGEISLNSYHFAYAFDTERSRLVLLDQSAPPA